jgi:type IV secretion system protein VirB6
MIRAVAAAFIFVWSQFLIGFINQTFQGNYSIANWIANLIPFLTIFVAFILNMVLVPSITQVIFGGGAGAAGKVGELAERIAALGALGGV